MADYVVPDYLRVGLNLVFVGFNPSLKSAEIGHYYAGRGNQFWPFVRGRADGSLIGAAGRCDYFGL